jgi:hypothetical protein
MSWVLFRWLTLGWFTTTAAFCALPVLFCVGIPEPIGFTLTRVVIGGYLVCTAVNGSVVAAGQLLGVNLLRCPLCRSWAGWVLRKGDPFLRCPGCGDLHGESILRPRAVTVGPPEDRLGDLGPRFRPVLTTLCLGVLALYLWQVARNSG